MTVAAAELETLILRELLQMPSCCGSEDIVGVEVSLTRQ